MTKQPARSVDKCPPMVELRTKLAKEGFEFNINDSATSSKFIDEDGDEWLIRLQTCFYVGDKDFSVISIWFERPDGNTGASYGWPDLLEVAVTGDDGIYHDPEPASPDEIIERAIRARGEEKPVNDSENPQYINVIEKCPPMAELRDRLTKEGFEFEVHDSTKTAPFPYNGDKSFRLQTIVDFENVWLSILSVWFECADGKTGMSYGWPEWLEVAIRSDDDCCVVDPRPLPVDNIIDLALQIRRKEAESH